MKSHDFGQFLFNSGRLNELQLAQMISSARSAEPTLAVEALFLQLISASDMTDIFRSLQTSMIRSTSIKASIDDMVRQLITQRQALRAEQLKDGQSIRLAQALVDNGLTNFLKLERFLDKYHDLQVPPLESMLTIYYERFRERLAIDFPFAIDLFRALHTFLSEELYSTVIILPPKEIDYSDKIGASVKLIGDLPVVTGIFADEKSFIELARRYEESTETLEDSFDVVSELLNVFTGHFAVKASMRRGLEEEPEPPRYGALSGKLSGFAMMTDVGKFYIYVNGDEIF